MRVLLVEDEPHIGSAVQEHVRAAGHAVDWVRQVGAADDALRSVPYDALLLDLHLPDGRGLDLLKKLRRRGDTLAVVILTARDQVSDRIEGLKAGADDYLVKPFDPDELLSRVRAVLRRIAGSHHLNDVVLRFGEIRIDASRREVWKRNHLVDLTAMEFDIFDLLARSAGRIVSRDEITEALFERKATPADRSLDVHISRLRKKLESGHTLIRTIRGVGYVFAYTER